LFLSHPCKNVIDVKVPDLDLDLLRCFLAVAESGGFTAAAKRLNLSQSAVSLKIQRLESILEREVFARTSRSLTLTREGEIVHGYAHRLLALSREMIQLIAQPAVEGIFRLGVMLQFGQQFLPQLLSQFKRHLPQVSLTVEVGMTADLLKALEEDRFDAVVGAAGYSPKPGAKLEAYHEERVLLREPTVWVQSASSVIDIRRDPLPLILFSAPCGLRKTALEILEKAGRPWQIVYSSTSLASIQSAVEADLGISILGRSSLLPGMKAIKSRAAVPALPDIAVALYASKTANPALVQSLSAFLSQTFASREKKKRAVARH
jgi:DNA-binding transcriptional LysR family regulator